jgi:hypothetical protein
MVMCCAASTRAQIMGDVAAIDTSTWTQISCYGNTCTVLAEILLIDSDTYQSVFWRTDDAGRTWHKQDPHLPSMETDLNYTPHFPINKVNQVDSLIAFAVGPNGLILSTFDGGVTWQKMRCPVASNLLDISCNSSTDGIIIGLSPNAILTLSEAGWDTVSFVPDFPQVCHSYGGGKFRVLTPLTIYTTLNNWFSVDSISLPTKTSDSIVFGTIGDYAPPELYSQCIFGQGDSIIVGGGTYYPQEMSVLARTVDGGQNWNFVIDSANYNAFSNIYSLSGDSILALDVADSAFPNGYTRLSTDLGTSWQQMDTIEFNKNVKNAPFCWGWGAAKTQDGSVIGTFNITWYSPHEPAEDPGYLARLTFPPQSSVSSQEPIQEQPTIYPNPATSILIFESSGGVISVLDPLGRSYEVKQSGNMLDVSALPTGVYFVSDGHSRAKFVKQ